MTSSSGDVREGGQIQLTTALNALARREKYLALETRGARHNLGVKFGGVEAQIALALAGVDRETDARHLAGNDRAHRAEQALRRRSSCR